MPEIVYPETELVQLKIAGLELEIEKVKNLDAYLDALTEAANENEDLIPYWSELWPSSIAMAEYLTEKRTFFRGREILELGCGIGLVASVMSVLGFDFLATDFQPLALELTEKNIFRNSGRRNVTRKLDWRKPRLRKKYDVIIASDVLYERRFFMPLLDLFRNLLRPGGKVIIAEPNRSVAKPFFDILREQEYQLSKHERPVAQGESRVNVSIWEIS